MLPPSVSMFLFTEGKWTRRNTCTYIYRLRLCSSLYSKVLFTRSYVSGCKQRLKHVVCVLNRDSFSICDADSHSKTVGTYTVSYDYYTVSTKVASKQFATTTANLRWIERKQDSFALFALD